MTLIPQIMRGFERNTIKSELECNKAQVFFKDK